MGDSSNPTAITEIEGRGRGVVATRPIKAGEVLLTDTPIILYSANPLNNNFCSNCFKNLHSSSTVLPCASCSHNALFCSPTCQSKALSTSHSPWVCQALTSLRHLTSTSTSTEDISDAHFLIAAYNLAALSPSQFKILLSLEGAATPASTTDPRTLSLHSLIASLSPPHSFVGCSLDLTAALLAKDKRNAFGLMEPFQGDSERNVRAYGIYPNASFFNHDCLPNAARFDYVDTGSTDISVRAIHDVSQGREICLCYFGVKLNYVERQQRLKEGYGFVCDCDRCKIEVNWSDDDGDGSNGNEDMVETEDDDQMVGSEEGEGEQMDDDFPHAYFFLKYVCGRENCGGTLAPLPPSQGSTSDVMECNVCGQLKSAEEIEQDEGDDGVMAD